MRKKLLIALLVVCTICSSTQPAYAGTSRSKSIYNWTLGEYEFHGAADYQTLYTNYNFTNMSKAILTVTNSSTKYSLVISVKSIEPWYKLGDKTLYSFTLNPGESCTWNLTHFNENKTYYLKFDAPSKFNGSINRY